MRKFLLLTVFTLTLAACSSDDKLETEVIVPPGEDELLPPLEDDFFVEAQPIDSPQDGLGQGFDQQMVDASQMRSLQAPTQEELVAVAGDRIFYPTDSSNLTFEAKNTLRRQANWLLQNPSITISVEGHCDERGTREYNLALGERRANAVKNFLVQQGISPNRINTISYGKEFPEFLGSNSAAWAKNRRAVTVID